MTKNPSLFTATDELAQVLGPDLAAAFIAHRKALRKPLIPHAAKLIANKLRKMSDPIAAAEKAIEHGWLTVYPEDQPLQKTQQFKSTSTSKPTMAALFGEMEEFFDGSERQAGSDQAAQGTLLGLPFDGRKH